VLSTKIRALEGKVAFITGGTTGIGLGIARAMLAAKMKVAVASRNTAHLQQARAVLEEMGGAVHAIQLDVADRAAMAAAADEVEQTFGKVHVLCSNAGAGIAVPISGATYNDWDWALSVNLGGTINAVQEFLPKIRAHGEGGHIVSTSSMSGLFLNGNAGVYSTTKFAIVGMMEALRHELDAENIGVSVYCPGVVNTNFFASEDSRPSKFKEDRAVSAELRAQIASALTVGMDPREAGEYVVRGIRENCLYILSHPEYAQGLRDRFEAILASMPIGVAPDARVQFERALSLVAHPVYRKEIERLAGAREARADGAEGKAAA
jgi:NAD(P)-dependent dehydrogenase (short-subunit alcohol dehydrogenase family)